MLSVSLFFVSAVMMLDKLGKGIVLREIMALHICFVCVIMPLAGYRIFDDNNYLARLWVKQMPVQETIYYAFALPATAGYILALCWPLQNTRRSDQGKFLVEVLALARNILQPRPKMGIYILVIGTAMFWIAPFLPAELQFAFLLFYFASFAGFLYLYYSPSFRFKVPILFLFTVFILMNAISSGMFTIIAYMGLTIFSFFFLGKRTQLWKKILWFFAGVYLLLILQSVKPIYRQMTWRQEYQENKGVLFGNLVLEKMTNPKWESLDAFFPIYLRTNQGFNIALTMRRIPKIQNYDNGQTLFLSLISAMVPRFMWPDKPEAGGKFNMKYYTGYTIIGWSTNVGPLGEGYGSFGVNGGIIFMIILGLFIRWSYGYVFTLAKKIPLLLFWIPVLFYQVTYSAETDTLQILNALVKSAFFIYLLYKLFPSYFLPLRKSVF